MSPDIISNPIINSPFEEPQQHFRYSEEGMTNEIVSDRWRSEYFVSVPQAKKRGKQLAFESWTEDRIEENKFINQVPERVELWRKGGNIWSTSTTRQLLNYWTNPQREKKLFFCQIEALDSAIYITEVANNYGVNWIENRIKAENEALKPGLFRIAFRMATGSGKLSEVLRDEVGARLF
jgi:type III restriction enzyme